MLDKYNHFKDALITCSTCDFEFIYYINAKSKLSFTIVLMEQCNYCPYCGAKQEKNK